MSENRVPYGRAIYVTDADMADASDARRLIMFSLFLFLLAVYLLPLGAIVYLGRTNLPPEPWVTCIREGIIWPWTLIQIVRGKAP